MESPTPDTRRPLTVRRLVGLDRSGPGPSETRPGQPLRPWTIPNLVGYLRLAGLPVFCYLAMRSGDGRTAPATALFAAISAGDYHDGLLARATGQYSRMGALLDPLIDRLTILSGAAVCWHFALLPRWALAVLAARELVTLLLAQVGMRRGASLEINWVGRLAVWPVMAAIFLAMALETWLSTVLLVAGLAAAVAATGLYLRVGLAGTPRRGETAA